MFPLFNYGVGLNSYFPDPKPIRAARESGESFGKNNKPVMSGNDVAAAVVALAASCAIMLLAFKKGKVDSEAVVKEVRTLKTDGIEAASSKIHEVKAGLEDVAARVKTRIFGDSAPIIVEPSKTVERVIVDDTVLPKATGKGLDLEVAPAKPAASTVTEPIAASKKVAEPTPAAKPTESPAQIDKSAEPPTPIIDEKPPVADIPVKPAVAEVPAEPPVASNIPVKDAVNPKADEMRDFVNNGLEPQATKAAEAAASAKKAVPPPTPPASFKTPTPPKGGTPPTSSAPPAPPTSSTPPAPPIPQAPPAPPVPQAPPAPPAAGAKAVVVDDSATPFAQTVLMPETTKPVTDAAKEAKVPHTYADYEADFEKGARAYIAFLGRTPESAAKLDEAMEAWGKLENIHDLKLRAKLNGQCHELMQNYDQAIASYKEAGAIDRLQKLQKDDGLPAGVFEQAEDAIAELEHRAPHSKKAPVMAKPANSSTPTPSTIFEIEPPHRVIYSINGQQVERLIYENGNQKCFVYNEKGLKTETKLIGKDNNVIKIEQFEYDGDNLIRTIVLDKDYKVIEVKGKPIEKYGIPETPAPKVISANTASEAEKVFTKGSEIYHQAAVLYKSDKKAAAAKFKEAMNVWMPLVEHDTDGKYLNAVGQCLQGQGLHEEAIKYYEKAGDKGYSKAKLNLAAHCETGKGFKDGSYDLETAIHLYDQAKAKGNLEKILLRDDLTPELYAQAKTALDKINSASKKVVTNASENLAGAQSSAALN